MVLEDTIKKHNMIFRKGRLFLCAFIFLTACQNQNNSSEKDSSTYYYYPKSNAYYHLATSTYIYSIDSGKNWTTLPDSTHSPAKNLGKMIKINSANEEIWRENEVHRKMYGGNLINLIRKPTDSLKHTVPKKTAVKKKKPVIADSGYQIDPPKKKRNLFQRIFGKKKRKTIEQPIINMNPNNY